MKIQHMTSKTQNVGKGSKTYRSFRMCLNLKEDLFKTSRYSYWSTHMNHMVITNQRPTIDTQQLKKSVPLKIIKSQGKKLKEEKNIEEL